MDVNKKLIEEKKKRKQLDQKSYERKATGYSNKALWAEVEKAFATFDVNKDGKLSEEECSEYIKNWCKTKNLTLEEFNEVASFEDIDENGDGFVSK